MVFTAEAEQQEVSERMGAGESRSGGSMQRTEVYELD